MKRVIPLYEKLVAEYEHLILQRVLQPGDKIDSITKIQKKYEVARETAKRCLKILAEKGLIVQRVGQGSFVANIGPKKRIWGFVIPFFSVQYDECIEAFRDQAAMLDREFRHYCSYDQWKEELRLVADMVHDRFEAIVVVPTKEELKTKDFYLSLSRLDSKVIFFDSVLFNTSFPYAIQNYGIGILRAMNYLREKKQGPIALIKDAIWHENSPMFEMIENLFYDEHSKSLPDYAPQSISRIDSDSIKQLLDQGVVAFICCNDYRALSLLGVLAKIDPTLPSSMSVVSFGNTDIARYFTPPITSIDYHYNEMIVAAIKIITDDTAEQQVVIDVELVIRST